MTSRKRKMATPCGCRHFYPIAEVVKVSAVLPQGLP